MNLQTKFNQITPFPFPFRSVERSRDEKFRPPKNYTRQELDPLEIEMSELKQKDNLKSEEYQSRNRKIILSRDAIAIIGTNGKRRFDEFKDYPDGWYGGKGKKRSEMSIFVFEQFVKNLPELKSFHPSLFFTLEGNLSLGWEDKNGQSIEVEFYPDKAEFFIESLNEESEVKLSNIFELTEKIRKLLQ